jgi:dienelactone hydrolase
MLILLTRFSWGARFVCHQLSTHGICKVGAIAHPSFLKESHVEAVQGEFPNSIGLTLTNSRMHCMLMYVSGPLYMVAPSDDELFPHEQRNRMQEILTQSGSEFSMQVYSGVGHGFAVSLCMLLFLSLRKGGMKRGMRLLYAWRFVLMSPCANRHEQISKTRMHDGQRNNALRVL